LVEERDRERDSKREVVQLEAEKPAEGKLSSDEVR
jgi:hypothetical protein